MKALLVVALFAAIYAVSAAPSPPTFPTEYRISFNTTSGSGTTTYREYYAFDNKKQRFDSFSSNSFGFFITINRFDQKKTYNITRGFGGQMYCKYADLKTPMQAPNFLSSATFVSVQTINGVSCNKWQDSQRNLWFTNVASPFNPVLLVTATGTVYTYGNLHNEPQPASLFDLPKGVDCVP